MKGLLFRWFILSLSILLTSYILDGIEVSGFFSAIFAAAILGVLNAFLRPVLIILTLPLNIITLGLFTFIINAMLLKMASSVIMGFEVHGFWAAIFGSLFISTIGWILNLFIGAHGNIEYIKKTKRKKVIDLKKTERDFWE